MRKTAFVKFRKPSKPILWASGIGLLIIVGSILLPFIVKEWDGWTIFCNCSEVLGFTANLAIVAAAIKFLTKETLEIKGVGKVKIRRTQNNIQDLTNLISLRLFEGKNFLRTTLLEAFYKNTDIKIEKNEGDYIRINNSSSPFSISRTEIKRIENLLNAVKWILNEGKDLDNDTLADIYMQWYRINQPSAHTGSLIEISHEGKSINIDRSEFENPEELLKVAQCILNGGHKLNDASTSDIYKKWYHVN
ncbi:MAG: hypothetical protein HDR88_12185 [Bacteroides sp.]|nr:hypothetical protein [Bacteroides sp.]